MTTRTSGSKATIKSRVDQWIEKKQWGDVMEVPKEETGSHATLFTSILPSYFQFLLLISSFFLTVLL